MPALTVFYDGRCGLCRSSAERIRRRDPQGRIALVDLYSPDLTERFPQVDPVAARRWMQAVDAQGRVYSGVDAWAQVAHTLPGWGWLGWLLELPGLHALAARVYDWVARNRYRWNRRLCSAESCSRHRPR